jgi:glyoxylase-like metal-dependent hydrolase (beta-lactamase superfamily II)
MHPLLLPARNPSPMTGLGNNTYLLGDRGPAALVDAGVGAPAHLRDLASALTTAGARLALVVATHGHRDHVAGAPAIRAAHPGAAFAKFPWPEEDGADAIVWRPLVDGEAVDLGGHALTVVATPGHSPDHVALWHEPSGTAFTGDLVVAGSSVMIHASRGGDLAEYLRSLERVRALGARRLLPAHGEPIDDPEAVLAGYIAHRLERERQVVDALESGRGTVQEITEFIYDGLTPALLPAAQENVRAHLAKLRADGRASAHGDRWSL